MKKVCDKFDASVELHPESHSHTRKSSQSDEKKNRWINGDFLYTQGRALKSSKVLNPNIESQTDPDALISWLNTQKEKLKNIIQFIIYSKNCKIEVVLQECN